MAGWGAWWGSALLVGALAVAAHAGDGVAGMEAHVDPTTGRLVSEPAAPAWRQLPAPLPAPVERPAPGGGMMSVVPRQYFSRMVATMEADGSVRMDCVVPAQQR